MGPGRAISQEAFEEMVRENMEDLGMDPDEALQDAIQSLTLQGVDLSGVVKCVPGADDNAVIKLLSDLKDPDLASDEKRQILDALRGIFSSEEGSENAILAARNGGVEVLCSVCAAEPLVSGLEVLKDLIIDVQSTEAFRNSDGPKIIINILKENVQNAKLLSSGFAVIAAAASRNEITKELFMDLKVDEFVLEILRGKFRGQIESLYESIRVLLTPDDNRVLASQVYNYARQFAKIGIADVLVDSLGDGLGSSSLVSVCIALKAVAVNDEICRSISDHGGIDKIFKHVDIGSEQCNKAVAKAACSLLSKLAGSDANKNTIVQKGGLQILLNLSSKFSEDASILQEIMAIFCSLSLRSPENAALAVEAGVGDMAIQAMQRFPAAYQMQKQSCLMIRNLVVRNPENRTILLGMGIEKFLRKAKVASEVCRNAAAAALRDLGFNDYNT